MFADLDRLEDHLAKKLAETSDALKLVKSMRKLLHAESVPKSPLQTSSAKKKQLLASKEYWRKVKAGEIKRKGYKVAK